MLALRQRWKPGGQQREGKLEGAGEGLRRGRGGAAGRRFGTLGSDLDPQLATRKEARQASKL